MCHYAIRTLMADTAATGGDDPDRISFIAALRIIRRSIAQQGDFPHDQDSSWKKAFRVSNSHIFAVRRRDVTTRILCTSQAATHR